MWGVFSSGIVRQLATEVLIVAGVAAFVVIFNEGISPAVWGHDGAGGAAASTHEAPRLSLPTLPFTLASPALGLLLVFRTNASYVRWSEARKLWGTISSHSRNVVRMASMYADTSTPGGGEVDRSPGEDRLGVPPMPHEPH